jgi:hypothetical protein
MGKEEKMERGMMVMRVAGIAALCVGMLFLAPFWAMAHCDTLDGPVVMTAKTALEKGDVTPVLKWVKKEQERDPLRL